ncbi:MAG: transcription elongation factor GreA [Bacilli bacterium]|nr:transcription elongation factor GreA [Bacilli bacterium]
MSKDIYLTKEGYSALVKELDYLRKEKRPKVIEELAYAAELGDLRENSEYDAVIHTQAIVEGRIIDLERILDRAKIISSAPTSKVGIGSRVKVIIDGDEEEYMIVSSYETDVYQNKISNESLIGASLMNKRVKDKIIIDNENQKCTMIITNIS